MICPSEKNVCSPIQHYCVLTDSYCACVVAGSNHLRELRPHFTESGVAIHHVRAHHITSWFLLCCSAEKK